MGVKIYENLYYISYVGVNISEISGALVIIPQSFSQHGGSHQNHKFLVIMPQLSWTKDILHNKGFPYIEHIQKKKQDQIFFYMVQKSELQNINPE